MTRLCVFPIPIITALFVYWSLLLPPSTTTSSALSSSSSTSEHAQVTRRRLSQAFSSPSGKLTFSPEIVIPEPTDPTAILLQTNGLQNLSQKLRQAKANAAFVRGSQTALQTVAQEQAAARGNFPGPVPVVYCGHVDGTNNNNDNNNSITAETIQAVAETGAEGVMIPVCRGQPVSSADQVANDATWPELGQVALAHGVQPIPEVTIGEEAAKTWDQATIESLVDSLCAQVDPVAVVLTVNADALNDNNDDNKEPATEATPVQLPLVPKELGKRLAILGSVRVLAGENRLGEESQRFKNAGFTGAFLRSDCVPGWRMKNLNLEAVGLFWSHCIEDLKSTKSKSFSFRSKNNMEKNLATKWANYQSSVMESGALGDPSDNYSIVDDAAGEYKGFA